MTEQDKQALIEYYCQRDCGHIRKECSIDNCHEIMLIEEFPTTPTDTDTISRQAAIDALSTWDKFGVDERGRIVRWRDGLEPYVKLRDVITAIFNTPFTQPEPKRGKWLPDNNNYIYEQYVCSECKNSFKVDTCMGKPMWNFCPYCGAKMER